MALRHACGIEAGVDTHRFRQLSLLVAKASRRPVPEWKAVVGERVFSHESGLHADGVVKDPRNYEGFDPGEVGLTRHFVVGKHSGASGIVERYRQMGIPVSRSEASVLVDPVREAAQRLKRPLSDADLRSLHASKAFGLRAA